MISFYYLVSLDLQLEMLIILNKLFSQLSIKRIIWDTRNAFFVSKILGVDMIMSADESKFPHIPFHVHGRTCRDTQTINGG